MSSTVFNLAPKLPAGCNFLKSILSNFLYFIVAIANASPKASCVVVLEVGTIPPASITLGVVNLISAALYKTEFFETQFLLIKFYFFLHTVLYFLIH